MTLAIVLGMQAGELLEPYSSEISKELRERIHSQAKKDNAHLFGYTTPAVEFILSKEPTKLKIYGSWDQFCVLATAKAALKHGCEVLLPYDLRATHPTSQIVFFPNALFTFPGAEEGLVSCVEKFDLPYTHQYTNEGFYFRRRE